MAGSLAGAAQKPNIVIMFIDDMGYGDIGPFGNKVNKTPNLDRMAEEGIKLTQFYVAKPHAPHRGQPCSLEPMLTASAWTAGTETWW